MKLRLGPNGFHLFDRSSGLNVLLDEMHPTEASWSKSPRQVSIALTNFLRPSLQVLLRAETQGITAY